MRSDTAESIVEELARMNPYQRNKAGDLVCLLCDRYGPGHRVDCLWARAQELTGGSEIEMESVSPSLRETARPRII
jgi:hypothetical protein